MSSRIGRTTVVYFLTQVGTTVAGFLATWYINWRLGAAVFGEYTTAVAFLFWLNIPASALGNAVNKRISEGEDQGQFLAAGHTVNVALHAVLISLLLVFREQVNIFIGAEVGIYFAGLVAVRAVFDLTLGSLRGHKQVGASGAIKTLGQVSRSGIQIGALFFIGVGIAGLIGGHIAGLLIATTAGLVILDGRPAKPAQSHFRGLFEYARYAWLGTLKTRAFAWTDVIMMRLLSLSIFGLAAVSKSQIGIYKVSWTVASVLALISIAIKQTLFPEMSSLGADDNYERVHHLLEEGLTFTGIFAIPGLFGSIVVGSSLLTIFGDEYAAGGTILVILIGSRLFAAYGEQFINAINAINKPNMAFRVNFIYVVANIVFNFTFITLFGWHGAAVATALSSLVTVIVGGYVLTSLIGSPSVPYAELARQVLASIVMLGVIAACGLIFPTTLGWTFVLIGIGAIVYVAVLATVSKRTRNKFFSVYPY